jgi:hypothetical protein
MPNISDDLLDEDILLITYDSYKAFGFNDAMEWKAFNPPPEETDNNYAYNGYKDGYDDGATKRQLMKHERDSTNSDACI